MKKKVLSLLLAIAMVCSLAACGGGKDPAPAEASPAEGAGSAASEEETPGENEDPASGEASEPEEVEMHYTFENGTLTCSGNGEIVREDWIEVVKNTIFDPSKSGCASAVETLVIEPGVTAIGEDAFSGCENLAGEVVIPDSVTSIEYRAFANDPLTSAVIPDSITEIGENAFIGCLNLTNVSLPKNLKEIPRGLFQSCRSLTAIEIPEGVTAIQGGAFCGCGLTQVTIPSSVTYLGDAFSENPLTEFTIPAGVTEWQDPVPRINTLADVTILCEATMDNVADLFGGNHGTFEYYKWIAKESGFTIHAPAGSVVEGYVKRQIETNQDAQYFTFEAI